MAEQPEIDPRYDPAFQRGYDGAVATGSRADAATRRAAPHVTSALQRTVVQPAAARPAVEPLAQVIGAPPVATEPDAAPAASVPAVVQVAAPALRPPWTNPFAIAVAIVGIAVLGAGVWLLQETYQLTQSESGFQSQTDYWFLQWGMIGGPIFTGLGIAILVAVLVLCAAYWSRRPEPPAE
jgi:hypothetical protein